MRNENGRYLYDYTIYVDNHRSGEQRVVEVSEKTSVWEAMGEVKCNPDETISNGHDCRFSKGSSKE